MCMDADIYPYLWSRALELRVLREIKVDGPTGFYEQNRALDSSPNLP